MEYFIEEFEWEDVIFYYRGLTVMEVASMHMDKSSRKRVQIMPSFWIKTAMMCVVDWDGVVDENGEPVPFTRSTLGQIPENILEQIGKKAYLDHTIMSDEEDSKLRGYVRFASYLSEQPESIQKTFSCSDCLRTNRYKNRKCGYTDEEREIILSSLEEDSENEREEIEVKEPDKNVKLTKKRVMKKVTGRRKSGDTPVASSSLNINNFKFPECPVSWVDDYIKTIGDQSLFCYNSKIPYFSGGVGNQLNKIYSMVKVVGGELSEIEHERHKELNKNKGSGSGGKGGRR